MPVESDDEVSAAAQSLVKQGVETVIVTLGARGSLLATREGVAAHRPGQGSGGRHHRRRRRLHRQLRPLSRRRPLARGGAHRGDPLFRLLGHPSRRAEIIRDRGRVRGVQRAGLCKARPLALPASRRGLRDAATTTSGEFAMTEGVMDKVRLGRTDLMVTSICFGTSGLGDMPDTYGYGVDEARAKATMHAIFDGPGQLHRHVAQSMGSAAARSGSAPPFASAAACPKASSSRPSSTAISRPSAFDAARARRSLEQSLKTLGIERSRPPASARSRARQLVRRGDRP